MNQIKEEPAADEYDDDIRSIESSDLTLGTSEAGNGKENESIIALLKFMISMQKQMNEMANNLEKVTKQLTLSEEKHQKEMDELKAKTLEDTKEIAILKEEIKEKINWDQVHPGSGKKLLNPHGNRWNASKTMGKICENGLKATNNIEEWHYVFAEQAFLITRRDRIEDFPGTILYYYEVIQTASTGKFYFGLSNGNIPDGSSLGYLPNSYRFLSGYDHCRLSGKDHPFGRPNRVIKPKCSGHENVFGCGLVLSPTNKLSIFFTGNGIVLGKQILINPTVDRLFPTVDMKDVSLEANFGDDSAKTFKYNIETCPGLVFQ